MAKFIVKGEAVTYKYEIVVGSELLFITDQPNTKNMQGY